MAKTATEKTTDKVTFTWSVGISVTAFGSSHRFLRKRENKTFARATVAKKHTELIEKQTDTKGRTSDRKKEGKKERKIEPTATRYYSS